MMSSGVTWNDVPEALWLSVDQMREVDRAMVEDYAIWLVQMMENAGHQLAELARERFCAGDVRGSRVTALVGSGGNGGGVLVAARRLSSWGAQVHVLLGAGVAAFGEIPHHQLEIAKRLALSVQAGVFPLPEAPDLILDGLIGYGLEGSPRGDIAALIWWANATGAPVLALGVPSGLHADTGAVSDPTIQAAATMTLALPKRGLRVLTAERFVGELYLADIGVPPELYTRAPLSLPAPDLFATGGLVRLR